MKGITKIKNKKKSRTVDTVFVYNLVSVCTKHNLSQMAEASIGATIMVKNLEFRAYPP